LVPRNVLVPIGLAILLIGGMWCVIRLSTPPDVRLAETPSVTPTATPMALASPPLRGGLSASGLLGWYATQRPGSEVRNTAINGLLSAPLAAIQITPVVLRQPTPLGVAPGIAHP
jgi:hypothetical protein